MQHELGSWSSRYRRYVSRMTRTENILSQKFRRCSENHFYPRFMLPCSLLAENIFLFFQSPHPSIPNFGLEVSPGNAISEGRPISFATRARKRELSIREVRIENESDRKYSKSKNFRSFSENHFYPRFMLPCSLLAENIFLDFKVRTHPSIHNFGLLASPGNAISEGRPPLCNTSSEAGALDTGGTYRE